MESNAVNPQFYKFHIGLEPVLVALIFASILSHFLLVQMFNREIIPVIMQHVFKFENDTTWLISYVLFLITLKNKTSRNQF